MTYVELVEKVSRAISIDMSGNEYAADEYKDTAKVALAAVYEVMIAPNNRMVKAACKAMSPEKRPTQDWVSVRDKHAYRFMAMIEASPLKPQDTP